MSQRHCTIGIACPHRRENKFPLKETGKYYFCFSWVWYLGLVSVFGISDVYITRTSRAVSMIIMYQSIPKPPIPPRATPGHLTRVKLRTVGNLTQNEARPVGHLTFESKRLSAVGNKKISQFFDSLCERRSRVIALVDST